MSGKLFSYRIPRDLVVSLRYFSQIKRKKPLKPDYIKEIPVNEYVIAPHKRKRVYVWGNLQTGALGVPQRKDNHHAQYFKCPKRLHFAETESIVHVATGFGYSLFATNNGVFGSGLNEESQLGYHDKRRNHPLGILFAPQSIPLASSFLSHCDNESNIVDNNAADELIDGTEETLKILKLSAGRAHSAVLTSRGLFLFGSNAYGQCGRAIVDDETYSGSRIINRIESIDGKTITDVVCGQDHSLVILEDGSVYGCGWGADGQTGLGHYDSCGTFTKVGGDIAGERITKIACRSDFVLALNDSNQVFGWGNTEYSQMVLADGSQQVCVPTHLSGLGKIGKIVDVASGGSFCLALSECGQIYVWGFGLLGVGPLVQESKEPLVIPQSLFGYNEFNSDVQVVSVHAGLSHLAAVTNKGDLYTWGRNRTCCLGLGDEKDQYFPLKVAVGGSVEHVSCGLDHMVAVCKSYITDETK